MSPAPPTFARMITFTAILPWALAAAAALLLFRRRPRLEDYPPRAGDEVPSLSVVIPARNEAANLGTCLATILNASYEPLEVIVVDDRSVDGTGEIARALEQRSDGKLRLVDGEPLPEGWFGKPWACWQGFQEATGDLVVFTDADTRHGEELLERAVAAMRREQAALVSVLPRQLLKSFWERIIMPHVLMIISARYVDLGRVNRTWRARDVIANGQFILVRRDAYESIGGHRAVRGEVVEDLRLAQRFIRAGERTFMVHAENHMETRMYRSLGGILEGWTKNLASGARAVVDPWLRPVIPWAIALWMVGFWVVAPLLLAGLLVAGGGGPLFTWSLATTALSIFFWMLVCRRFEVPMHYAVIYPVGAAITAGLFVRSALRGGRVLWKGRHYGEGPGRIPVAGS